MKVTLRYTLHILFVLFKLLPLLKPLQLCLQSSGVDTPRLL